MQSPFSQLAQKAPSTHTHTLAHHEHLGAPQPRASGSTEPRAPQGSRADNLLPLYRLHWVICLERHREGVTAPKSSTAIPALLTLPLHFPGMWEAPSSSYLVVLSCPFACGSLSFVIFITVLFLTCTKEKRKNVRPCWRVTALCTFPLGIILAQSHTALLSGPAQDSRCPRALALLEHPPIE